MLQRLKIQNQLNVNQSQKLRLSYNIHLCLKILQLPLLELKQFLQSQIESNFLLEFDFENSQKNTSDTGKSFSQPNVNPSIQWQPFKPSLFEYLMKQAHETFESKNALKIAEMIIGSLNKKGYLEENIYNIAKNTLSKPKEVEKVLHILQRFDPIGVAARNLQECLMIQAHEKFGEKSLSYRILQFHFDDLLHCRMSKILKKFTISKETLEKCIKIDIASLSFHPGASFSQELMQPLIPDIELCKEKNTWAIKIHDEDLPPIHFHEPYLTHLLQVKDISQKREMRKLYKDALWLKKAMNHRNHLLTEIVKILLEKQPFFFKEEKLLLPLTIKDIAQELNISQSTASRAIADKYIKVPFGIFPLRSFFSTPVKTAQTEIAQTAALKILKSIISHEDKKRPYTDIQLVNQLRKQGITCARRTIAKYRRLMKIASAKYRQKRV